MINQENLDSATRRIQSSMTQILPIPEGKKVEPLGSAIFIEFEDKLRLLSAGHLTNLKDYNQLLVPIVGSQQGLFIDTFGDLRTTNIKGEQANNEIDFAEIIFRRDDKVNKVLEYYTKILSSQIDFNHQPQENDDRYFIFGYPNSRARFDYVSEKEMNSEPLRITTHPITDVSFYDKHGYSKEHHILLKMQRKLQTQGNRIFLPKTKGLSGCGVYYLPDLKSNNSSDRFKLVGILTEVDFEKQFATVIRMDTIYNELGNDS